MRRFYFDTEASAPNSICDDHCGNIRGARTIAQKLANELNEVVYINDCETNDIVESVFPDSVENTEPEIVSEDVENKLIFERSEIIHLLSLLTLNNSKKEEYIDILIEHFPKDLISLDRAKKDIEFNNVLFDKLKALYAISR